MTWALNSYFCLLFSKELFAEIAQQLSLHATQTRLEKPVAITTEDISNFVHVNCQATQNKGLLVILDWDTP